MTYVEPGPMHDLAPQPWRALAACAETDAELWFPQKGASNRIALSICATCPVAVDCLRWALGQEPAVAGIWGGTTERDRRRIRQAAS